MHKSNLEDHVQSKHKQGPEIPCDKCDKKFATKTSLYAHRREQHVLGDSRKVQCDICNLWYKGSRNLKKHQETHSEEAQKKFQCLYCHKTFRTRNSLVVHERIHTGETPYACRICLKHFKRSHHLYSHLKCADHTSKLIQWEAEGKPFPDPIFTVAKSNSLLAPRPVEDQNEVNVAENYPGQTIFMVGTGIEGASTVQVVVPTESLDNAGALNNQFFQSAVLLTTSDEYQEFSPN